MILISVAHLLWFLTFVMKNATFATTQIAEAAAQKQALAVGELKRKFEYFVSYIISFATTVSCYM